MLAALSPPASAERLSADPFRYRHQGDLATIGRRAAVVNLKHLQLTGLLGWLFWSVVHIYFLIGLRSRFVVAFSWAWQYLTFQRGARLITGIEQPGVERGTLHRLSLARDFNREQCGRRGEQSDSARVGNSER